MLAGLRGEPGKHRRKHTERNGSSSAIAVEAELPSSSALLSVPSSFFSPLD